MVKFSRHRRLARCGDSVSPGRDYPADILANTSPSLPVFMIPWEIPAGADKIVPAEIGNSSCPSLRKVPVTSSTTQT